jgi:NADPH2:quinone reductase
MQAIRLHQFGGPEVSQLEQIEPSNPSPGEVLVKVQAAGITQWTPGSARASFR